MTTETREAMAARHAREAAEDERLRILRRQLDLTGGLAEHFAANLRAMREWREQHRSPNAIPVDLRVDGGEWPDVSSARTVTVGEVLDVGPVKP